jgi:hypothetical protein
MMTDPFTIDPETCAAAFQAALGEVRRGQREPAGKIALDPENVERDLARLVLALMEFLRQLMEMQAIRRMERGALTPEEEERVGETLMRAAAKLRELAAAFGLSEADLTLDLGPLGRLV